MFQRKLTNWTFAALVAMGTGAASVSRADVIVDTRDIAANISSNYPATDVANGGPTSFESFTYNSGFSNYGVQQLQIMMDTAGATDAALVITLWPDDGSGNPTFATDDTSTPLATLDSISLDPANSPIAGALGNGPFLLSISNIGGGASFGFSNLVLGDTYWIGIATSGDPFNNSATETDDTSNNPYSNGEAYAYNTQGGYGDFIGMCASTDNSCDATNVPFDSLGNPTGVGTDLTEYSVSNPEPATLAVLGSALTGLGLIRRRRRASQPPAA